MINQPLSMRYRSFIQSSSSNVISDNEQLAFNSSQDQVRHAIESARAIKDVFIRNIADTVANGDVGFPLAQQQTDVFSNLSRKYDGMGSSTNYMLRLAASHFKRSITSISVENENSDCHRILANYANAHATANASTSTTLPLLQYIMQLKPDSSTLPRTLT
jgi:hypothetical protein